jgi:EpsI family protein
VRWLRWAPASLLAVGAIATVGIDTQRSMPLRTPLAAAIPTELAGYAGVDVPLSDDELREVRVTEYVVRSYASSRGATAPAFSVYVAYYARQTHGRAIHSPKNCLPGAGWEALSSRTQDIATPQGAIAVNRYLMRKGGQHALVLYWYQGRGRVEPNEYRVKFQLLRDAALRGRSEEALVRIVVPVERTEHDAFTLGSAVAAQLVPAIAGALPD